MSNKGAFLSLTALSAIAAAVTLTAAPKTAAACAESGSIYIGTVCMTAANFCPDGYVEAQGQLLPINTYNALYSLVGTTYGGDARSTFGVPDFRGRSPVGLGTGPGLSLVQFGEKRGVETVTLTQAQMPIHNHTATFVPTGQSTSGGMNVTVPAQTGNLSVTATPNLTATGAANLAATTSGTVKIAAAAPTTGSATQPTAGAVLAKPAAGTINIYNPTANADLAIGGTQTFTGTATGTVNSAVSGTISTTVSGNPSIASYQIQVPYTMGNVTVGNAGGSLPATNIPPQQAARFCVAVIGLYPPRP